MNWPDMIKDIVLLVLGGVGTAIWFFWRRRAEQAAVFENIQKAEKLLFLRKELDSMNYTVDDLKMLENVLMGRAEVARELGVTYEREASQVREIELRGAMTQGEMNAAAAQAYENAQRRLDSVIFQMKQYFSPEESLRFDGAHSAWQTYQQAHAMFLASQYEGGSIQPLIHASALETVTVARLVELEAELKLISALRSTSTDSATTLAR